MQFPGILKKAKPATPSWLHEKKKHSPPSLICFRFYCAQKATERAFQAHKLGAALLKYARSLQRNYTKLLEHSGFINLLNGRVLSTYLARPQRAWRKCMIFIRLISVRCCFWNRCAVLSLRVPQNGIIILMPTLHSYLHLVCECAQPFCGNFVLIARKFYTAPCGWPFRLNWKRNGSAFSLEINYNNLMHCYTRYLNIINYYIVLYKDWSDLQQQVEFTDILMKFVIHGIIFILLRALLFIFINYERYCLKFCI